MSIIFKMLKYLKNYSNLIKTCTIIALVVIVTIQTVTLINHKSSYKEEVSVLQTELDSLRQQNEELKTKVSNYEQDILDRDEKIGQLEDDINSLTQVINKFDASSTKTSSKNTTVKADGNYNQATQVWNSLRALGLNEYVCAGIIGNIMAEVGGQTLDISRWPNYSKGSHYGICQWGGSRKKRLLNNFGTTLEDQIRFLSIELFEVIPKGNSFYNMQDEKEAALYFAKYYERCGTGSYSVRQSNATKALNYFIA